jgi:hypothetical protein
MLSLALLTNNLYDMLLDISAFWQSLTVVQKIYWVIAIPASTLFIIQLVLTFIGVDHDTDVTGHSDLSVDGDSGISSQFFSFKSILAFFTVFSWTGIACIDGGLSVFTSIAISILAGIIIVVIMATLFYYMSKLSDSGTLNINNAIHKIGTVYLTIPGKRKAMGKVQVKVQGLQTLDAFTDDEEDIKTGSIIEVTGIVSNEILLVKRSI